mgnify:FL=1
MKRRKKYILIISLIAIIVVILGVSYALLQKDIIGSNGKVIYQVGDLEVKLDESSSKDISLTNAIPEEDSEGLTNEPYSFSLVNNATTDLKYTIYLEDDIDAKNKCGTVCELVPYKFIRYNLSIDNESLKTDSLSSSSNELYIGTINSKSTDKFNLRIWLSIDADNTAMSKYYFGKLKVVINQGDDYCIRNGFKTLSDCMLVMNNHESSVEIAKQNITAKGTPDFSKTATTDESLFMAEDDEGASYYYRGAVKNNYVSFAGFIWKIIRRNGDGSIRMIYSGKKTSDTREDTAIGKSSFNVKDWDVSSVGYMYNEKFSLHENNETTGYDNFNNTSKYSYGTGYTFDETTKKFTLTGIIKQLTWKDNHDEIVSGKLYSCLNRNCNVLYRIVGYQSDTRITVQPISYSSDSYQDAVTNKNNSVVKSALDKWYKNNLTSYTSYLADETFCNDRSFPNGSGYLVYQNTQYSAFMRIFDNSIPTLKCTQANDSFKVSNESAKLDYPVALITADEVAMAGGVADKENNKSYLYNGVTYWTMTPSYYDAFWTLQHMYTVDSTGSIEVRKSVFSNMLLIRPVINLKSDVEVSSGDGSSIAPFKVK